MPSARLTDGLKDSSGASHYPDNGFCRYTRPDLREVHLGLHFITVSFKCLRRVPEFMFLREFPWTLALVRAGAPGISGRLDAAMCVAIGADHFLILLRIGPRPGRLLRTAASQKTGEYQVSNADVSHRLITLDSFLHCVMLSRICFRTRRATQVTEGPPWTLANLCRAGNTIAAEQPGYQAVDSVFCRPAVQVDPGISAAAASLPSGSDPKLFAPWVPRMKPHIISTTNPPINGTRLINSHHAERSMSCQRLA